MAIDATLWGRRVEVTVSGTIPSLAGYVGLITGANLPSEIWTRAINGGGDLRACLNSDGTNQIPLEVVLFDTTAQDAILWARFPSFATGSSVWLFYDKNGEAQPPVTDPFGRNAVFADMYRAYLGGDLKVDVTGNNADNVFQVGPEVVGSDSLGDYTTLDNNAVRLPAAIGTQTELTISSFHRLNDNAGIKWIFAHSDLSSSRLYFGYGPSEELRIRIGGSSVVSSASSAGAGLHHAAVRIAGGNLDGQVDGLTVIPSQSYSGSAGSGSRVSAIGAYLEESGANNSWFLGDVYSLFFYSEYKSDDYLATEYANQNNPATFWTTGTPEDTGGGGATYTITLDSGSYSLSGQDVDILSNKLISLEPGDYTYDGQNVDLFAGRSINLESGNYAYDGQDVNLLANRSISLEPANYTYTGQDVTLVYNPSGGPTYLLTIDAGAYNYSGQDTQLIANRTLSLDGGNYAYTGIDLSLLANRSISVDSGAYVVSGNAVALSANRAITLDAGNYAYTGSPVTLSYSGEVIALISGYSVNYAQDAATATYIDDYIKARFI